jgi:uncharacterized repeat protein (TIGR01451 family)
LEQADLQITKSGTSQMEAGLQYQYDLVVFNGGPGTARNVLITDNVPTGALRVDSVSGYNSHGALNCTHDGNAVSCVIASMIGSDVAEVLINVTALAGPPGSQVQVNNTARVTGFAIDNAPRNNNSTHLATVETLANKRRRY